MGQIVRITRARGVPQSELSCFRLPEDDCPCFPEKCHGRSVPARLVTRIDRGAVLSRHVDGVYYVFTADWNSKQRSKSAAPVALSCLPQRTFRVDVSPRLDVRLSFVHPS